MVSKLAAAIVAAFGLSASAPAPHVVYSAPKKPQAKRKKVRKRTHSSVYRILEAHQQRLKKEKRQLQLT